MHQRPKRALLQALGEFSARWPGPAEPNHTKSGQKRTEAEYDDCQRE